MHNITSFTYIVSKVVNANKSLWCDLSVNAVGDLKKIVTDKLGFIKNIFGQEKIDHMVETEAARMFKC